MSLPDTARSERLQWMFNTRAWSDLTIEAGAQAVRTYHVHKAILCPALCFVHDECTNNDGSTIRPKEGVESVHIPESPEAIDVLLKFMYGFQDPRLQLKTIHTNRPDNRVIFEFRLWWDLRQLCRKYELLVGSCFENCPPSEFEEMMNEVLADSNERDPFILDIIRSEIHRMRRRYMAPYISPTVRRFWEILP